MSSLMLSCGAVQIVRLRREQIESKLKR